MNYVYPEPVQRAIDKIEEMKTSVVQSYKAQIENTPFKLDQELLVKRMQTELGEYAKIESDILFASVPALVFDLNDPDDAEEIRNFRRNQKLDKEVEDISEEVDY